LQGELNGWIKFNDPSNPKTDEEFYKMAASATGHGDDCLVVERYSSSKKVEDAARPLPPPPQVTVTQELVFVGQAFGNADDIQVVTEMVAGSNMGEGQTPETFKEALSVLAKEDPARYRRILDGDEVRLRPRRTRRAEPGELHGVWPLN
jgi:hypothetical protein